MAKNSKKNGSALAALCGLVGTLAIILVLVIALLSFIPPRLGYGYYNVLSGSMEPEIPIGSLVVVEDASIGEVAEGDVIAFRDPQTNAVVTHRLVEVDISRQELITKGDANSEEDLEPIPFLNLIGKVVWHFAGLGALATWLLSMSGKVCLLVLLIAGFLLRHVAEVLR